MNVLVVGCGNLGSRLAESLCHHGHEVSIIDTDEGYFRKLSDDFDGVTITGMPMDLDVFYVTGVECRDAIRAVTI